MSRKPVNAAEYVAELNRRLRADPLFRQGMEFKQYPDGKVGPHTATADASGAKSIPALYGKVEEEVAMAFEIVAVKGTDQPQRGGLLDST